MGRPNQDGSDPNDPNAGGNPAFTTTDPSTKTTTPAPNWQDPSTYSNTNKYNTLIDYYHKYLGRDPDQGGFDNWYNSNLDPNQIKSDFQNSQEGLWYASSGSKPYQAPSTTGSGSTGSAPSYINMSDPASAAVWQAFQAKGISPRDQSDFQYWVDKINQTGGWSGGNQSYWQSRMAQGQGGVGDYSGAPEAGVDTTPSASSSTTLSTQFGPQNQQLLDLLMGRAQQSLNIDPTTDPIIRPQVDNFAATQERSRRNYLNDLAESSSPYATGAQQTAATQTAEASGQNTANLQSQLTQNELTARRTEIQNALSEAGSLLTADQQLSLQKELGLIDASLRQQQVNSQNDQFAQTFGLQQDNQNNYWNSLWNGTLP